MIDLNKEAEKAEERTRSILERTKADARIKRDRDLVYNRNLIGARMAVDELREHYPHNIHNGKVFIPEPRDFTVQQWSAKNYPTIFSRFISWIKSFNTYA